MQDIFLLKQLPLGAIYTFKNSQWELTNLKEPLTKQNFELEGFPLDSVIEENYHQLELMGIDEFELLSFSLKDTYIVGLQSKEPLRPALLEDDLIIYVLSSMNEITAVLKILANLRIRFSISRDKQTWYGYNDGWHLGTMNKHTLESLDREQWNGLLNGPAKNSPIYIKVSIETTDPRHVTVVRDIVTNFFEPYHINPSNIIIETPALGFRKHWIEQEYVLKLVEGFAFDDASIDHDLYTTPDRIKLRPLGFDVLVGGKMSDIQAFEVINAYEDFDYNVELTVSKGGLPAQPIENYCLLNDAVEDRFKTKVVLSLSFNPFSPMYPVRFRLDRLQKRIVYVRITPQLVTSGNERLQVRLIARPV